MTGLLFIDDEEGVRRSVVRALKKEPYVTFTAADGLQGVQLIKDRLEEITIVISDFKMPGADGLETLSIIGRLNPEITRIILTGYATMDAAISATNQGIDGFLTKPFDNTELRVKIREILIRKRLRQLVSEQVLQRIENTAEIISHRSHPATVLFSDIRGFTGMSQHSEPEKVASYLNHHYFTPMSEIAYRHDGATDKHIGDGIMVVFGTLTVRGDEALRAVTAACEMQRSAKKIDRSLRNLNGFRMKTGIGIATGTVLSGIFGSLRKREYTSIGMPVIIAWRLQQLAKAGEIMICEQTYKSLNGNIPAVEMAPIVPKGLEAPIQIYRVTP